MKDAMTAKMDNKKARMAAVKAANLDADFKTAFENFHSCLNTSKASCSPTPLEHPKPTETEIAAMNAKMEAFGCEMGALMILKGVKDTCHESCMPVRPTDAPGKDDNMHRRGRGHGRRQHDDHIGCFEEFCNKTIIEGCAKSAGIDDLFAKAKAAAKTAKTVDVSYSTKCSCLAAANKSPAVSGIVCSAAPTAQNCADIKAYETAEHPRKTRAASSESGDDDSGEDD